MLSQVQGISACAWPGLQRSTHLSGVVKLFQVLHHLAPVHGMEHGKLLQHQASTLSALAIKHTAESQAHHDMERAMELAHFTYLSMQYQKVPLSITSASVNSEAHAMLHNAVLAFVTHTSLLKVQHANRVGLL